MESDFFKDKLLGEKTFVIDEFIQIFMDEEDETTKTESVHLFYDDDETILLTLKIDVVYPFKKQFAMRSKTRRKFIPITVEKDEDDFLDEDFGDNDAVPTNNNNNNNNGLRLPGSTATTYS